MTNDYKWLRILKKFLRSYVYEWRGTPMLCPKSPHRLYRCCCCCRCRCRQAVGAVNAVTAVNASTTSKTICDMRYTVWQSMQSMLNVNIQKLKSVALVPQVPRGTNKSISCNYRTCSTWNKL